MLCIQRKNTPIKSKRNVVDRLFKAIGISAWFLFDWAKSNLKWTQQFRIQSHTLYPGFAKSNPNPGLPITNPHPFSEIHPAPKSQWLDSEEHHKIRTSAYSFLTALVCFHTSTQLHNKNNCKTALKERAETSRAHT